MLAMSPVGLLMLFSFLSGDVVGLAWAAVMAAGFAVQLRRWKRAEREVHRLEALVEVGASTPRLAGEPSSPEEGTS